MWAIIKRGMPDMPWHRRPEVVALTREMFTPRPCVLRQPCETPTTQIYPWPWAESVKP